MSVNAKQPRIAALRTSELTAEQRKILDPFGVRGSDNVFRTMVRHPDLLRSWIPFIFHVLSHSSIPFRAREILILRTAILWNSDYEWAQHVPHGRRAGLSDEEIAAIVLEPDAHDWSEVDRALLICANELVRDGRIMQPTWEQLCKFFDEMQMMDLVVTVGQYSMVAMALNSFGVEIDSALRDTTTPTPQD